MSNDTDYTCHLVTRMSRFAAMGHPGHWSVISAVGASRRELQGSWLKSREFESGVQIAYYQQSDAAARQGEDKTMARSIPVSRPRTRQHRQVEERPVLQLPLDAPQWREPPQREQAKPDSERGVAVIDFFI